VSLTAEIDWDELAPAAESNRARLELVRDGALIEQSELQIPIRLERTERLEPGRHYYRLRLTLGATQLLSNPIFVDVASQAIVARAEVARARRARERTGIVPRSASAAYPSAAYRARERTGIVPRSASAAYLSAPT